MKPARTAPAVHRLLRLALAAVVAATLSGCGVILVAGTAAGLAVDAAVGAVKLTGAAVGAAADLVIPDGDDKKK